MNYQTFKKNICSRFQELYGPDIHISIQDILKNNDTHLDGLTILSPGTNISPTIYLNPFYEQFKGGTPLEDIVLAIQKTYEQNRSNLPVDASFFTDYEKVSPYIVCKLVNYTRNRELLADVPHYRFLDLAIVFHCLLKTEPTGTATILIHNHHLSLWDATPDDLYALGMRNTPRLIGYDLRSMSDILREFMSGRMPDADCSNLSSITPLHVLSSKNRLNGSICILYPNLLLDFANRIQSDLFILPSSVHEVLLLPAEGQTTTTDFSEIVQQVNLAQLTREEILSDHAYYFSRETNQITM